MNVRAILPIAGVVGGIYSAGFLFGYNYHSKFAEISNQNPEPVPAQPGQPPKPSDSFATNPLIYKYGLPVAGPTLHYTNHILLYDQARKIPRWVAETLTEENLEGTANRKHSNFKPDTNLPEIFRATNEDFRAAGKGMSRGHMAPAGDNKQSQAAMDQSFLLSNILPQNYANNAGFWNRLEMYCRDLTSRWEEVHVISGPVMKPQVEVDPETKAENKVVKYRVVGENNLAVPTHLFKVILCRGQKGKAETDESLAVGAFIVPNEDVSWSKDLADFQIPVEEAERLAGLSFYSKVDRKATRNLCEADPCKLIKRDEFDLWIISRQLKNAESEDQVRKALKKVQEKSLTPDLYFSQLLDGKCVELGLKLSDLQTAEMSAGG